MTQKGTDYHESAIQYNVELAECAEDLMTRLVDEEVTRWAHSVAKQHRFHEGRHRRALERMTTSAEDVVIDDSNEDHVVEDEQVVHRSAVTGEFVSEEEAAENPDTTVEEHMDAIPVEVPAGAEQDAEPVEN